MTNQGVKDRVSVCHESRVECHSERIKFLFYKLEALCDHIVSSLGYKVVRIHPLSLMGQTPLWLEGSRIKLVSPCPAPRPAQ